MSYRVYLIDDEWFMVRNIAEQVDWAKYGMEVAGTANNADTALQEIEELKPELIITDIMMPGKTGIDLIRELHARDTTAKMLIISGHDRFSFAKEALECGVVDYLLKPIRFEELEGVLEKVAATIDKERERQEQYREVSDTLERTLPKLRAGFARSLLDDSRQNPAALRGTAELLSITLEDRRFTVVTLAGESMEPVTWERWGGMEALEEHLEQQAFRHSECLVAGRQGGADIVLITPAPLCGDDGFLPELRGYALELLQFLFGLTGQRFQAGIGRTCASPGSVCLSRYDARMALACGPKEDGEWLVADAAQPQDGLRPDGEWLLLYRSFHDALVQKDQSGAEGQAMRMLAFGKGDPESSRMAARRILYAMESTLATGAKNLDAITAVLRGAEREIALSQEQADMRRAVAEALGTYFALTGDAEHGSRIAGQVRAYIQERFREKISIQDLSEAFYLTPNYLSTVFKKSTGATILEYITGLRIEEAKRLLRENSGMKMYEVAERVGYSDQEHFRRIFKKLSGVNPKQFK